MKHSWSYSAVSMFIIRNTVENIPCVLICIVDHDHGHPRKIFNHGNFSNYNMIMHMTRKLKSCHNYNNYFRGCLQAHQNFPWF